MYQSAKYPTDSAAAEAFVAGMRHGYLIATAPNGFPQVSVLPFVKTGDEIELHCVQADPTFAAIQANPRVTFFVCDFLAWSRHDWIDASDAARATLNFKAAAYAGEATTSTDPREVAAALARLLAHYEPAATYTPIEYGGIYADRIDQLAVVRSKVVERDAKFKVGPAGPAAVRRGVVAGLRRRGAPGDARAADVIEATLPVVDR